VTIGFRCVDAGVVVAVAGGCFAGAVFALKEDKRFCRSSSSSSSLVRSMTPSYGAGFGRVALFRFVPLG